MEIQGAGYLYSIAAAAMAFVGFSAIVVILRQTLGASLTSFQLLLMRLIVEHGFVVVFLSLLPSLLALFDIPHELIWRLCSGVATFVITVWLCHYMLRRYPAVRSKPQPLYVWINVGIQTFTLLALLGNAVGVFYRPQVGVYAAAISWTLFQGADIFLLSLKAFLREPRKEQR
jgi:hypothetical protein